MRRRSFMRSVSGGAAALIGLQNARSSTSRVVNVCDFGAQGDGEHDDGPAIQAAIDHASTLYFPAGTYRVSCRFDLPDRTVLSGDPAVYVHGTSTKTGWDTTVGVGRREFSEKTMRFALNYDWAAERPAMISRERVERSRKEVARGDYVSHEDLWRRICPRVRPP